MDLKEDIARISYDTVVSVTFLTSATNIESIWYRHKEVESGSGIGWQDTDG